ncbi:MAG: PucR family transcriptional regulator ligand-binding domain-containing protein, partial [Firmicutes bacterium]|nr:PucR family transcriptional regulator ligand-binding domain-containing protein [Bacillota bacterium]
MNYTISDMLRDNLIPQIEQLVHAGDLGAAEIAAVTVQEYPADDFVQPGDLVLSTADGCTDDEARFSAFLSELAASKASGVLFAFRDKSYQFPASLCAQARKAGLPVFRIPWELRFAQVQTELIRKIHRRNVEYVAERKLKNDFVWNLATGNFESMQQMAADGLLLKFDLARNFACIRFRIVLNEGVPAYSARSAEAASLAESAIESACRLCGLHGMYAARSLEFILYPQVRSGRESDDLQQMTETLRAKLTEVLPDAEVFFGVTPAGDLPADFPLLAQQAGMALEYASGSPDRIYAFKDAEEAAMIAVLLRDEGANAIAKRTLAPLLAADEKGGEFLQTA